MAINLGNSTLNRKRRIICKLSKDIVGCELLFNQSGVNVPKEVIRESINANETTEDARRIWMTFQLFKMKLEYRKWRSKNEYRIAEDLKSWMLNKRRCVALCLNTVYTELFRREITRIRTWRDELISGILTAIELNDWIKA